MNCYELYLLFILILIPLILLYICRKKKSQENFSNWLSLRFFHKGDFNPFLNKNPDVATAPCHFNESNDLINKEHFSNNFKDTQSLRFFHPGDFNPFLNKNPEIATAPCHYNGLNFISNNNDEDTEEKNKNNYQNFELNSENFSNNFDNTQSLRFFHPGDFNPFLSKNPKVATPPVHSKDIEEPFLGSLFSSNNDDDLDIKELEKTLKKPNNKYDEELKENIKNSNIKKNNLNSNNNDNLINPPNNLPINIQTTQPVIPPIPPSPQSIDILKNLDCKFFHECPKGYKSFGQIGINSDNNSISLNCNGVSNSRQAKAVAIILNGSVESIIITDEGHGYLPNVIPKISIEGNGTGCKAQPIVDDFGRIKAVKILSHGMNYTETPNVIIDYPSVNNDCNFCCKSNS